MGCCLVQEERLDLNISFEKGQSLDSLTRERNEQENNDKNAGPFQKLETKALEIAGISDIVTAMNNIQTTSNIAVLGIPCIYPFVPVPSTVRALALAYLCVKCDEQMKNLKHFIRNQCKMLTDMMNDYNEDIKNYILILMVKCLYTQSQSLKAILLEHGAMKAFVKIYKDPQRQVRLLAAEASGLLMRNFEDAQEDFIRANGHDAIVQLLKREETESDALLLLFEVIFDLIYVKLRQDQDGNFIPGYLSLLLERKLFDVIASLDLFNVSFT